MFKDEEYFLNKLRENEVLYKIFCCIGDYSTVYHEEFNYLEAKNIKLEEIIKAIKSDVIKKDDNIIQGYIDTLIKHGLCNYIDENGKDIIILDHIEEDIKIALTTNVENGCSGVSLYKKIIADKRDKELNEELGKNLELATNEILKPYDEKIEILTKELDDKMSKASRTIDNGVIKNIQVISVFAGIISLLFANIMGIKEFTSIGVLGLLILNLSIVTSIFTLLLFTKLIIVGGKLELKTIIACLLILLLIALPIILIA